MLRPTWFRLLLSVLFLLVTFACSYIVWKEYHKRKQLTQSVDISKYQKRLNIFSMICLSLVASDATIHIFSFWLCGYTRPFSIYNWLAVRIFITFYQTARLQYCFSSDQVHSEKYGYSNGVFVWLFIQGAFLLIMITIDLILELTIKHVKSVNIAFRCSVDISFGTEYGLVDAIFDWVVIIWYYVWDWTIIFLYIRKCYQFFRKNMGTMDEIIAFRIKFILNRILLLTLLLEVDSLICIGIDNLYYRFPNVWTGLLQYIVTAFDELINAYFVYLMLSHNDDEYIKFIEIVEKLKLCNCCCMKWVINNALLYGEEKQLESVRPRKQKTKDMTYTDHELPQRLKTQMVTQSKLITDF